MPPAYIRTPSDFEAAVKIGQTPESTFLDFKSQLDTSAVDWQKEVCRDIAQFANTEGGCLLIGVAEKRDKTSGVKVAAGIRPVDNPDQVRASLEQAIVNHLVPSTLSPKISFIGTPDGMLVSVNVQPSRTFVYVWDRQTHQIECLRRTNHGKAWLNPDELERHMMNGSRAALLALTEARDLTRIKEVAVAGPMYAYSGSGYTAGAA